ncbi:MAG: eukaryotic-like serine/threonine-protein kinase [Pseudonocardiales bacterium]|nr:eukaryotic-like serine/threonine-protein kinase [Pseudonocardiales bacterium]
MQTAPPDTLVGRSLEGRYRILERIARGGMSTVYAAVDERLDRLVAVKVMSSALSADPAFSDRFSREARAAARLTHLNTVSVYDQGQEVAPDGHHVFLVMELVEGRTLRELLRERGRLSTAEAVSIMEPVLSALSAAHRAGLVHRDVKPENILLSDDGIVKVADFGLARAVEADAAATRTGLMMGTVAYCAPEQITEGASDPRSDVYSAGVVFFELLTGSAPYKGDSAMNVAYQHVHSRVPAPSSRVKGIPNEIDELVIAATDSDPEGRPADAGAFLAEIADVRTDLALPVVAVPPRARPRGRPTRAEARDYRHHTPDTATTDQIRGSGIHDTTVVPRRGDNGQRPGAAPPSTRREDTGPPPPIVIPPPKQRRPVSERARKRRKALIVLIVFLLLGALAGIGGNLIADHFFAHVPKVVGESRSAAAAHLKDAGYQVHFLPGQVFDETVPKDHVVRTQPGTGERLSRGSTVTVTLSAGPQTYKLPNVTGKSVADARAMLAGVGNVQINDTLKPESNDRIPADNVTRTVPPAGATVTSRDMITIYVSTGPPIVNVPSISEGTPLADAEKALREAHLKYTTVEQYSDTVEKGTVLSLDPSDKARKFSTVTITVSKGPEFVKVPQINQGARTEDAVAALKAVGLVPNIDNTIDGGVLDRVLSVDPAPDTLVPVGSTVTLKIV